jgi:hypothetical protein
LSVTHRIPLTPPHTHTLSVIKVIKSGRFISIGGPCVTLEKQSACTVLIEKPCGKRSLCRLRYRWDLSGTEMAEDLSIDGFS